MADKAPATKGITPDWLVRGVLTKVGDIFDRLTGRGWKPSSSLATSELIERLKGLLDAEIREDKPGCKFVPHNIKLKMQWDKFSTDSEEGLKKLEAEMLAALVDHINDKHYFTHAPLSLEVKPDYFSSGVRLLVSFDKFSDDERETAIHLSDPVAEQAGAGQEEIAEHQAERSFTASFSLNGLDKTKTLVFTDRSRFSVGRTKENDLVIDDRSVSKIHASLTVNSNGQLIVADTGSTNGTFIGGERIPYGKTALVGEEGTVKFGTVEVKFKSEHIPRPAENLADPEKTEAFQPRELEFATRTETIAPVVEAAQENNEVPAAQPIEPAKTEPSIPGPTLPSIEAPKTE
jgi:pSer/pThr/pTyr-binding forkhead associated (FHA) protein